MTIYIKSTSKRLIPDETELDDPQLIEILKKFYDLNGKLKPFEERKNLKLNHAKQTVKSDQVTQEKQAVKSDQKTKTAKT